jgi:hypothetical protein
MSLNKVNGEYFHDSTGRLTLFLKPSGILKHVYTIINYFPPNGGISYLSSVAMNNRIKINIFVLFYFIYLFILPSSAVAM